MPISVVNVKALSCEDRLTRARIQLNKKSPFFGYLVMNLEFIRLDEIGSIGVSPSGTIYYNEKFVKDLTDEKLMGVLAHEVSHVIFEHQARLRHRKKTKFNIACDIIVNNVLVNNGFELPENGLIPCGNGLVIKHPITKKKLIELRGLDKDIAEGVYDKIEKLLPDEIEKGGDLDGFDEHLEDDGKQKKEMGKGGAGKPPIDWKKKMTEAYYHSKNAGQTPLGIERHIEGILHPKRSYYELLYRYIVNEIPYDTSYSHPSKRSHAIGVYLPHTKREHIEMVTVVDTSGSIDAQRDLKVFLEGIVDIAKSFQSIKMTILSCDTQIHSIEEIHNGNIEKVMELKLKGGGGTKFTPAFKWIADNKPEAKLVIFFTDGENCDGFINTYGMNTIWILTPNGTERNIQKTGLVLRINE